ncbi:MAG TPA: MBL fold metallo-hydrolase [Thermoplasmata archaeon]
MIPTSSKVSVVLRGRIERQGDVITEASSSVTLIQSASGTVIVDTAAPKDKLEISSALGKLRVSPLEVDTVVNTHMHIDHCGCNDMFANAKVYAHALDEPPAGTIRVSGPTTLMPGAEIVPTPGHTRGSISVFVDAERKYAICGDAIPTKANYDSRVPPFIAFDRKFATRSMELILAWADVVVPGHDGSFEVMGKK